MNMMVYAVLGRAGRVTGQLTAGRGQVWGHARGQGQVWGQWLLVLYLLSGSATGVSTPCSDFLSAVRSSPDLRLLRFSVGQSPCGSPYEVPADLPSLPWHPDSPTVVVVPGRRPPEVQPSWVRTMAGELLATGLSNVLAADWLAAPEQEITEGARQVGERLAQVIRALLDQGSSPGRFHLIGFGVGAHVAGVAGKCLHGAIGRITGLDPFAPVFSEANISFSLSYTDAQYVDVIHTNFNPNEPVAALGGSGPVGHVDFYISRGHQLPGCPPGLLKREEYLLCSHQWAYKIFTSSIHDSCPFTAIPCRGVEDFYNAACTDCHLPDLAVCPQLGYDISWLPVERPIPIRPLTAFLSITAKAPFCVSPFLLELHIEGNNSLTAQLYIQLKGDKTQTTSMLVSGSGVQDFYPQHVYKFMVSVERAENFKTMSLKFFSQRLLYFQWRKKDIFIGQLLLIQLPRFKGGIYRAENILAVENQSVEVHLKL